MDIRILKRFVLGKNEVARGEGEIQEWMGKGEEQRRFVERMRRYYGGEMMSEKEVERRMERMLERLPFGEELRKRKRWVLGHHWVAVVACAVVVVGVGFGLWRYGKEEFGKLQGKERMKGIQVILADGTRHEVERGKVGEVIPGFVVNAEGVLKQVPREVEKEGKEIFDEVIVPEEADYRLVLEDGTEVMLNAGTRMRFPSAFGSGERRVILEGEAYFEVARDEARPFTVDFEGGKVRVLGTQFNVKAYDGEVPVATLLQGKVEVASGEEVVVLLPGETCRVEEVEKEKQLVVGKADLREVLAWRNGEFVFKDASVERVLEELGRWYGVEMVYDKDRFAGKVVHVYMNRSLTLTEAMENLSEAWNIVYNIENERVIIN